jgi:hypothetical protein
MTKIKIRSNPYNREISYLTMDEATGQWVDVRETDERSVWLLKTIQTSMCNMPLNCLKSR